MTVRPETDTDGERGDGGSEMDVHPALVGRCRILLADDEVSFRDASAKILRLHGFECVCAGDGEEALRYLRGREFDLLVADIQMPGNSRLELVQRAREVVPGLPVVLLTGNPNMETAVLSVRLPVLAYLTKPVEVEELVELADQAARRYRTYRMVGRNQDRLSEWSADLERLKAMLTDTRGEAGNDSLGTFVSLSLRQVIEALVDLRLCLGALLKPEEVRRESELLGQARPLVLMEALREVVSVLEKTKASFKSKELGFLRRKLEGLIEGRPDTQRKGPSSS